MATSAKKAGDKLVPLADLLADDPPRDVPARVAFRMRGDEYELFRKLAQRYGHTPQSALELFLNEGLVRRGIEPFQGVSGKLTRKDDPLRDWDTSERG